MANEIKIDLKLSGEQATARGLDRVGDAAEGAGSDLEGMAKDAGFLDKRLDELRKSTRELADEFARTGNQDVFKKLKTANRELAGLERVKKQFFSIGVEAGGAVGKGLIKSLAETGGDMRNAMHGLQGPAIAGAVAIGAGMAPFLGAAISSAVLGGVGTGGLIGGIALAARDSRVQQEAEALGGIVSSALTDAGSPFVGPVIESIGILKKEFGDTAGDLREAFGTVAPVLSVLTKGIDGLVDEAMPGLIKGMEGAKPVLRAVAHELPAIGRAVGDFFETVAEDPDAAIAAVHALSVAIQDTVQVVGGLTSGLSDVYEWSTRTGAEMSGTWEKMFGWMPVAGLAIKNQGKNFRDQVALMDAAKSAAGDYRDTTNTLTISQYRLGGALSDVTGGLEIQRKAMLGLVGTHLDMRRATADVEEAIDSFSESVAENGRSLDERDEKGRNNIATIEAGIDALLRGAQAAHDNALANGLTSLEAEAAAKRYRDKYIPALEEAAVKAGWNREQVQKLLDVLTKLDGKQVVYHLVQRGGLTIGAIDKKGGGFIPAGFEERAAGGPVLPGQTYVVGENGPEVLQMGASGGHVYNAAQTAAMTGAASAPMMTAPPVLNVNLTIARTGQPIQDVFMEMLAKELRIQGGVIGDFEIPSFEATRRYEEAYSRSMRP